MATSFFKTSQEAVIDKYVGRLIQNITSIDVIPLHIFRHFADND